MVYRLEQFWHALWAAPALEQLDQLRSVLTPSLMDLFLQMQPSEQAHSLRIFENIRSSGNHQPDLMVAALLHDVGKSCHPLRLWERAEVVVARRLFPNKVRQWGMADPHGWRRPFSIAEQHPVWGAEMASQAGASALAAALIRRHQEPLGGPPASEEDRLLSILQNHDDRQ